MRIIVALGILLFAGPVLATTLVFDPAHRVASAETRGLLPFGSWTWNGQPVSESNRPTDEQRAIETHWNFYVDPAQSNALFVQVEHVQDTRFGFITGSIFQDVALTGIEFELPTLGGSVLSGPAFSNQFANLGQALNGRPSSGDPAVSVPLDTTPGWELSVTGTQSYQIATADIGFAMSHFENVYGTTRINGGGVFQLVFGDSVDLVAQIDFGSLAPVAIHGFGSSQQRISGDVVFSVSSPAMAAVPEPGALMLFAVGFGFVYLAVMGSASGW